MSDQINPNNDDRREFFRINDAVRINIVRVPEGELEKRLQRLEQNLSGSFTVMSSLAAISSEMAINMRRIEHKQPDVAAYLRAIDRKIEVLGRAFLAQESDLVAQEATAVNLSAGGMGMMTDDAYSNGDVLEIKMLLFPSFTGVLTYGTVIDSKPLAEGEHESHSHQIRVEFTHMREQDRDVLIRHILRCQSQELRGRQSADEI